jgi:hypothetical protein
MNKNSVYGGLFRITKDIRLILIVNNFKIIFNNAFKHQQIQLYQVCIFNDFYCLFTPPLRGATIKIN